MLRISEIKLPVGKNISLLEQKIIKMLRIDPKDLLSWKIVKKSLDARKKPELFDVYTVDVSLRREGAVIKRKLRHVSEEKDTKYHFPNPGKQLLNHPPVIVGSGPAGLFCAYMLAKYGYQPILIERGAPVEERIQDVEKFWKTGILNPESNVQFGEGGAGTFSDGKLNTLVKDKSGRNRKVLELFVENGAPEQILYDGKAHIGTDLLTGVVKTMREAIISFGGTVRFHTCMTDLKIENGNLTGLICNETECIPTDLAILALGHSARDSFYLLKDKGLQMSAKAFAVGVRAEHPQSKINISQYGSDRADLPAAPYKLAATAKNGRNVYSFCMCPGGFVVNASSEEEMTAVNGMSYSGRNGIHANSALIVSVTPDDFPGDDVLAGVEFQRALERAAYREGNGRIPVQRFIDFKENTKTTSFPFEIPQIKGQYTPANLRNVLPPYVTEALLDAFPKFAQKIHGFDDDQVLLSGVESRTSSPVRITRDASFQSNINGIYPCGEGAGYAGGITSAAMDGLKIAEAVARKYRPFSDPSEKINM